MPPPFATVPGDVSSPCVLHVPHASRQIPAAVRAGLLIDDHALDLELAAMTDAHTDLVAAGAADHVTGPRPWAFVNGLSRLVVDPERFPDEREVMNEVGMGAVYTRTSSGAPLRDDDPVQRAELASSVFRAVRRRACRPRRRPHRGGRIGRDHRRALLPAAPEAIRAVSHRAAAADLHRHRRDPHPPWLRAAAHDAFSSRWEVAFDGPFGGTYVPLRHYGIDVRVTSVMLEIRRDVFVGADGGPMPEAVHRLSAATAELVDAITARQG